MKEGVGTIVVFFLIIALFIALPPLFAWVTNTWPAGLGVGFLLMVTYLITSGIRSGIQSKHWPTVEGTVVRSDVEEHRESSSSSSGTLRWRPAVEYIYTVHEREYRSKRLSISNHHSFTQSEEAQEFADQFPTGKNITVYCNPRRPDDAVLIPGFDTSLIFVAVLFTIGTLIAGYFAFRHWEGLQLQRIPEDVRNILESLLSK